MNNITLFLEKNKKKKLISSILILLFFLIISFLVEILHLKILLSDWQWSAIFFFMITVMFILHFLNGVAINSLYSLFFITALLFLGGRLISTFFYPSYSPFELFWLENKTLTPEEIQHVMMFLTVGFLAMEIGFYFSLLKIVNTPLSSQAKIEVDKKIIWLILLGLFSLVTYYFALQFAEVLSGGYLALYQGQTKPYHFSLLSKASVFFYALGGFFLMSKDKKIQISYLFLLGLYSFGMLSLGTRGPMVSYILFLLWLRFYMQKRKMSVVNISFIFIIIAFVLTSINYSFGRGETISHEPILKRLVSIVFAQGVTLRTFAECMYVENFPLLAHLHNFFPATTFIANLFLPVPSYDSSFTHFCSYTTNATYYMLGHGMGWSLWGDFYVYSFQSIILFGALSAFWGFLLNSVEVFSKRYLLAQVLLIPVSIPIFTLPRGGLDGVIPQLYYIFILYVMIHFLHQILHREKLNLAFLKE